MSLPARALISVVVWLAFYWAFIALGLDATSILAGYLLGLVMGVWQMWAAERAHDH